MLTAVVKIILTKLFLDEVCDRDNCVIHHEPVFPANERRTVIGEEMESRAFYDYKYCS